MSGGLALTVEVGQEPDGRRRRLPDGIVLSLVGSAVTLAVLLAGSMLLIRRVAEDTALEHAAGLASQASGVALAPTLSDSLLAGEQMAIDDFERAALALLSGDEITHLKVWTDDGRVVWADEPALRGLQFELGGDELGLFGTTGWTAEVSHLEAEENRWDATEAEERMLEVYFGSSTVEGTPVVVELYVPYGLVADHASDLRRSLMPLLIVVLGALALLQVALVLTLGRRLSRSERRQTRLLRRMIETSDAERRRVAAEVHDGVVQDLVGVSYALSAAVDLDGGPPNCAQLADVTSRSVAALRGLLSSIYPVSVPPEGWVAGLDDLVTSLRRLGVDVTIDVVDTPLGEVEQLLLLRVAREALRNVSAHAAATRVTVRLRRRGDRLELTVSDDGRGFDPSQDRSGHFGLTLIEDLIDEAGGTLETVSELGAGTTVRCDLVVVS